MRLVEVELERSDDIHRKPNDADGRDGAGRG